MVSRGVRQPTCRCPACGFPDLAVSRWLPTGEGCFDICPCCAFEPGITDLERGYSSACWRALWVQRGMPWESAQVPAPDWWPASLRRTRGAPAR